MTILKIIFTSISLTIGQTLIAQADAVVGKWETDGGKSHIEIYKKDNEYFGKIVWLKEPRNEEGKIKRDENNPDESKRSRPLKGLQLLKGFEYIGNKKWEEGEIYDPESGKTYSCVMTLKDNDNELHVRGYIGFSLIGRTTTWKRIE